jgi:hypothetical protein
MAPGNHDEQAGAGSSRGEDHRERGGDASADARGEELGPDTALRERGGYKRGFRPEQPGPDPQPPAYPSGESYGSDDFDKLDDLMVLSGVAPQRHDRVVVREQSGRSSDGPARERPRAGQGAATWVLLGMFVAAFAGGVLCVLLW